jgi:hypothetical protein
VSTWEASGQGGGARAKQQQFRNKLFQGHATKRDYY